jgi:7-cyano-7-deazaguanine synthase
MSIVALVSGGLDSTLVVKLAIDEGLDIFPLFVEYGQRAKDTELKACIKVLESMGINNLEVANLSGFGALIKSGLTDPNLDIIKDAFTPGRNLLFLLTAAAYAYQKNADAISIGLLHESTSLFPDQTSEFLNKAEALIELIMGYKIKVLAPLSDFVKADVIELAKIKGISKTYSCHTGEEVACGKCISCNEFKLGGI